MTIKKIKLNGLASEFIAITEKMNSDIFIGKSDNTMIDAKSVVGVYALDSKDEELVLKIIEKDSDETIKDYLEYLVGVGINIY